MDIRIRSEEMERNTLSPVATLAENSRGRSKETEPCSIRTCFQRDRDRIVHSNSFRRLMNKTQVFLSPEGDHYRTRLTHTIEVSQIACTIARALCLNEDLTEAIAMGHDLGHPPFGHAGERVLNELCPGGFAHNLQSVRTVEKLEKNGQGLNLTWEVKNGIACHCSGYTPYTTEGKVVAVADRIAYLGHDIEDAQRAGVLREEDIPKEITDILGSGKSARITMLISSAVENSSGSPIIKFSPEVQTALDKLGDFMYENVYTNPLVKGEESKAEKLVAELFGYYTADPKRLPVEYEIIVENKGRERAACDYISGMSDRYAVSVYESLNIPKAWGI